MAEVAAESDPPHFADSVRDVAHMVRWEPRSAIAAISRMGLEPGQSSDRPGISPFVVPSVRGTAHSWELPARAQDFRARAAPGAAGGGRCRHHRGHDRRHVGRAPGDGGDSGPAAKGILHAEVIVEIGDRLFARKFAPRERLPHLGALIRGVAKARR